MPSPETLTPYQAEMVRIIRRNVPLVKHLKDVIDESGGNLIYVVWKREGEATLVPINETVVIAMWEAALEAGINLTKSRGIIVTKEVFREANQLRREDLTVEGE